MKVFIDISKPSIIKFDDEQRNIFKGDNLVDAVKVYCNDKPTETNIWKLQLSAKLSNGRVTRTIDADNIATEEIINGTTWYRYDFTLSRANGITLCEGMATFYILINYITPTITREKTIGSFNAYIYESEVLADNIVIMGQNAGEVIKNFQAEIDDIRSVLANYDAAFLTKQNVTGLEIPDDIVDGWNNEVDFFNYFWRAKTNTTRYYEFKGFGENKIFEILSAQDIYNQLSDNKSWKVMINLSSLVDGIPNKGFSILVRIIDTDTEGNTNYAKQLYTNTALGLNHKLKSTGWIDLNYLSILKERDIDHDTSINRHDDEIKDLQGALTYNNIGLTWVSDFDVETGNITYILNPNFEFTIDDSRLEADGEIDWYVRPKSSLVNKGVE